MVRGSPEPLTRARVFALHYSLMPSSLTARGAGIALALSTLILMVTRCGGDDFSEGNPPGADASIDAPATDSGVPGCPNGSKLCAGNCVPFDDPDFGCGEPVCNPCPSLNGKTFCNNGCQINCDAGFDDCDQSTANGCETYTKFDPTNCGACGKKCNPGQSCVDGSCIDTGCPSGQVTCTVGGQCISLGTTENCAHCSDNCGRPNTQAACEQGKCVVKGCSPGFADCDDDPKNGCEANLQTSGAHCGVCKHKCDTSNAISTECAAGKCVPDCQRGSDAYFGDCNTPAPPASDDGCETNLKQDGNCGGCGLTCQPGLVCGIQSAPWPRCVCEQDKQCLAQIAVQPSLPTACNEAAGNCNCPGSGPCSFGEVCVSNAAQLVCDCGGKKCKGAEHCCNGACIAVLTDPQNCGTCGIACGLGKKCVGGSCVAGL